MIYLPKTKRIQTGETLRCENWDCVHRTGPQSPAVIVERPYSQTLLVWTSPAGYRCRRAALLCCDCRAEVEQGTSIMVEKQ